MYNVAEGHVLLQSVERADPVRLGQAVVLAPVDDEHGRGPLVDEVDGVEPARSWELETDAGSLDARRRLTS